MKAVAKGTNKGKFSVGKIDIFSRYSSVSVKCFPPRSFLTLFTNFPYFAAKCNKKPYNFKFCCLFQSLFLKNKKLIGVQWRVGCLDGSPLIFKKPFKKLITTLSKA
jgi:hypothetical protein